MSTPWFKRWGWFYLPAAVPGYAAVVLAAAFCVQVFVAIDRHSHSVSDTLYGFFPYAAPTFLLINWLAARTSEPVSSVAVEPDA